MLLGTQGTKDCLIYHKLPDNIIIYYIIICHTKLSNSPH